MLKSLLSFQLGPRAPEERTVMVRTDFGTFLMSLKLNHPHAASLPHQAVEWGHDVRGERSGSIRR